VLALSVFHKTPAATTELASAFELSHFGFFQHGTVQVKCFSLECRCGLQSLNDFAEVTAHVSRVTTHVFSSGIHEVFRPTNHNPDGPGASPISNSIMCSCYFVSPHIALVGAHA
jgi:hypothetical protein